MGETVKQTFEELAYDLLEQALLADMDPEYFWETSYANIVLKLQAYAEKEKIKTKHRAVNSYTLARLIGINVASLFSKNSNVPSIEKCFPDLFEDENVVNNNRPQEEVVEEGQLCKAEMNFLTRMIALQNQMNAKSKADAKNNKDKE